MADDFKKLMKEGKACIGGRETLAQLKKGELKKVYLASNCPGALKADILYFAALTKTEIEDLRVPNEEFGIMCKKPFSVAVLGVKKDTKK